MNIETGIFSGWFAIVVVALSIATQNRWNWRRDAVQSLVTVVCASAVAWFSYWVWTQYSERPLTQHELWEIKIGDSLQEIRFKKGLPYEVINHESGLSYSYKSDGFGATVRFGDEKVRSVYLYGVKEDSPYFRLQGIQFGDTSKQVMSRFGNEPSITSSKNGLNRIYAFPRYHVFFGLSIDKVEIIGIYDEAYPVPIGFSTD